MLILSTQNNKQQDMCWCTTGGQMFVK